MAFNFGAFIGGASDNLVEMIKTKEAQLYKEEQDEKERLRKARVAAANQRRADENAAKERIGALTFQGYTPESAAQIVKMGEGAYNQALSVGEQAFVKGVNVNSLFTQTGSLEKTGETLSTATDKPVGPIGIQWDNAAIKTLYGESTMPDIDTMLNANAVSQMKLLSVGTLTDDQQRELEALQKQETELLTKINKRAVAEKVESGGNGFQGVTKVSDATAFENSLVKTKGQALQLKGFKVDFNEELIQQFEGRVGEGLAALYQGVTNASNSWQFAQDIGDPYITNRITAEKAMVENELRNYATRSAAEAAPIEIPNAASAGAFDNVKTGTVFTTFETDETTGMTIPILGVYLNIPNMPIFVAKVG